MFSLLKSINGLICWCLLLAVVQVAVGNPLITYHELDTEEPSDNEYEVITNDWPVGKTSPYLESNYYPVRGKKTLTAGKIASLLSALSRERNGQSNDKLKGQRFGITKRSEMN